MNYRMNLRKNVAFLLIYIIFGRYRKSISLKGGLMKTAKATLILASVLLCISGTVLAADRVVIGEMFTNTS